VFDDFLPGERFDVVISQEVLEHVPVEQQAKLLASCRDRLVTNGLLVLTTPNRWAIINRRRARGQSLEKLGDQPYENIVSVRELRAMAQPYFHIHRLYTVHDTGLCKGLHRFLYSGRLREAVPGWSNMAHLLNAKIYSILLGTPREPQSH
jgi:2-polyprenyl-3-methyl-5-hydroxy-6-metoxy-1,4-benzoquinol methylase